MPTSRCPSALAIGLLSLALVACSSDDAQDVAPERDAGPADVASEAADDASAPDAPPAQDAPDDVAVEAGPTDCAEACATACDDNAPVEGECATCAETVCAEYKMRAETAANRDLMLKCMDNCDGEPGCADDCCNVFKTACAYEITYEMCTCGFPEDDCTADCAGSCTTEGLTTPCGVCASQSPCTLPTFDYLFSADRNVHQDCVDTCASSELTLEECLDRCRTDWPIPGEKYDAFLACVCAS